MKNSLRRSFLALAALSTGLACGPSTDTGRQPASRIDAEPVSKPEAEPVAEPASDALPPARTVLDRFAKVTHAAEVIARTHSLHATGSFSMSGTTGPVEIWSAKPSRRSVSMELGGFGTMITGFDGKNGWMTQSMMGARLFSGTELLQAMLEAPYDASLKPSEFYESMKTLGRETFEEKECLAVELVAKPLAGMDAEKTRQARTSVEYYEVASGLLIGSKSFQEGELGSGPVTQVFSDYTDFGGQLLATRTLVRQSGLEIELAVTAVEYDTATEATFTPPAEIQQLLEPRTEAPK